MEVKLLHKAEILQMEKLPFINDFVLAFSWKRVNDNMKVKEKVQKIKARIVDRAE